MPISSEAEFQMILPYHGSGDLFDVIIDNEVLPEKQVRAYILQLVHALEACHRAGVAHLDGALL